MTGAGTGTIGVNTSFPTETLDVNGTFRVSGVATASKFNATSDYRIKENVKSLDDSFSIDSLCPVYYFNKITKQEDIGFIAHELQKHYPILVTGKKDDKEFQTVNYIGLIGILVKEVQDLKTTVRTATKIHIHYEFLKFSLYDLDIYFHFHTLSFLNFHNFECF
jgi:hypothetical protein